VSAPGGVLTPFSHVVADVLRAVREAAIGADADAAFDYGEWSAYAADVDLADRVDAILRAAGLTREAYNRELRARGLEAWAQREGILLDNEDEDDADVPMCALCTRRAAIPPVTRMVAGCSEFVCTTCKAADDVDREEE
jgi:hypothetical protein